MSGTDRQETQQAKQLHLHDYANANPRNPQFVANFRIFIDNCVLKLSLNKSTVHCRTRDITIHNCAQSDAKQHPSNRMHILNVQKVANIQTWMKKVQLTVNLKKCKSLRMSGVRVESKMVTISHPFKHASTVQVQDTNWNHAFLVYPCLNGEKCTGCYVSLPKFC